MRSVVAIPKILLPARKDAESMRRWSVVACDQFTSDKKYWEEVAKAASGEPSTLSLVFPEVYLKDGDKASRIERIGKKSAQYLSDGTLQALPAGFVLCERTTPFRKEKRFGVVLSVDLETYSFEPQSSFPVRATEETVPERLPARVEIRERAKIEAPHAMLLYDAVEEDILGFLRGERLEKLYDFDLMQGGGHLRGWFLPEETAKEVVKRLYENAKENFLFAVGDGNHSLAAAKVCWEKIKKDLSDKERETHPARYALAEAVSIYSPALAFEPIHRFVSGVDARKFLSGLPVAVEKRGDGTVALAAESVPEALRVLDKYIAEYIGAEGGAVDYIHGDEALESLVKGEGRSVGILSKAIGKEGFFAEIEKNGSLPRKTFSMGEGAEKRYYTECKEI